MDVEKGTFQKIQNMRQSQTEWLLQRRYDDAMQSEGRCTSFAVLKKRVVDAEATTDCARCSVEKSAVTFNPRL